MAESIWGCFEMSSVNEINKLQIFPLASHRHFGQGQKAATFFNKISQEQSLGHILPFFSNQSRYQ